MSILVSHIVLIITTISSMHYLCSHQFFCDSTITTLAFGADIDLSTLHFVAAYSKLSFYFKARFFIIILLVIICLQEAFFYFKACFFISILLLSLWEASVFFQACFFIVILLLSLHKTSLLNKMRPL